MSYKILHGDCIEQMRTLPDQCVNTCVTSPPYFGLRDYGHDGQIGLEATPDAFVAKMVDVFREVRRVLRDDGTVWLNLGDSYAAARGGTHQPAETLAGGKGGKMDDGATVNRGRESGYNPTRNAGAIGLKHKDLIGIPWRVAFALQADGWYLRSDIIWHKPNPMPESVTDRPTKAHEYLFLLAKSERYYYDSAAIAEPATAGTHTTTEKSFGGQAAGAKVAPSGNQVPGKQWAWGDTRNRRSVWTVTTKPYKGAHFATFPPELIRPCILAGCQIGGTVLDPFGGSGTTAQVAIEEGREAILCELNADYIKLAHERLNGTQIKMLW
jgi:site-specific DNA-methyltransferase (adenine-specific)